MNTTSTSTTPRRGRPPSPTGPKTAAQLKREQRQRDAARLLSPGASFDTLTTSALLESIPALIARDYRGVLGDVLVEIGRRGGVVVRARPATGEQGTRVKA